MEKVGTTLDIVFDDADQTLGLTKLEKRVVVSTQRSEDNQWHVRQNGMSCWVADAMCDRTNLRAQIDTPESRLVHAHDALQGRGAATFSSVGSRKRCEMRSGRPAVPRN